MKRLQNLSLKRKKIIVWTVAGIGAVLLFFIQISAIKERGEVPKFNLFPGEVKEGADRINKEVSDKFETKVDELWGEKEEEMEKELKKILEEENKKEING